MRPLYYIVLYVPYSKSNNSIRIRSICAGFLSTKTGLAVVLQ